MRHLWKLTEFQFCTRIQICFVTVAFLNMQRWSPELIKILAPEHSKPRFELPALPAASEGQHLTPQGKHPAVPPMHVGTPGAQQGWSRSHVPQEAGAVLACPQPPSLHFVLWYDSRGIAMRDQTGAECCWTLSTACTGRQEAWVSLHGCSMCKWMHPLQLHCMGLYNHMQVNRSSLHTRRGSFTLGRQQGLSSLLAEPSSAAQEEPRAAALGIAPSHTWLPHASLWKHQDNNYIWKNLNSVRQELNEAVIISEYICLFSTAVKKMTPLSIF